MEKRGSLPWMRFSCGGCMLLAASARSVSLNVARFHFRLFFGIVHPRSCRKVPKKPVWGVWNRRKTAFRQEKCCTIRNLPRKSESCNKIRRFLPWVLISWQVLAAWCPLQAWCLDGEARGSVACAGSADRDRGGDRVRERLDHARPAHGVRGALRQEPVRPAPQGYSRRRDHARPQPKELIPRD